MSRRHTWTTVAVLVAAAVVATAAASAPPPARWCGSPTGVDQPDVVSAFQIHVVYATPADAPDRFGERAVPILSDLAAADEWWQAQDPTRAPRLDLLAVGCDSRLGAVDLTDVRLPQSSSFYGDGAHGSERIAADLEQRLPRVAEKKYLVYYDGPVQLRSMCGSSPLGPPRGSGTSVVFLDSACASDLGRGGQAAATAVHELLHSLGARPLAHGCAGSPAHVCDNNRDVLYRTTDGATTLADLRLDVGHDDYYDLGGRAAAGPDVRNSPFLEHLDTPTPASLALRDFLATSTGTSVTLRWTPAIASPGLLYRIYREGRLLVETAALWANDTAQIGTTAVYTIRATDPPGHLGPARTIRFLVGKGLVDETGWLIRDTIAPPRVTGLRATRNSAGLVLRWRAVADPGDLAGYRVYRDAHPFRIIRQQTQLAVKPTYARATWTVAAVDTSGNIGPQSRPIRIASGK